MPAGAGEHDERRVEDAILRRRSVDMGLVVVWSVVIGPVIGSGIARGATSRFPM
jgi:hypothetical protein